MISFREVVEGDTVHVLCARCPETADIIWPGEMVVSIPTPEGHSIGVCAPCAFLIPQPVQ